MKKKFLIGTALVSLFSVTSAAALYMNANQSITPVSVKSAQTSATASPEPSSTPTPSPVPDVSPVVQDSKRVPETPTSDTPPTVTYKWAAEMSAAGIASSDYQYVTDMVLDDNGWHFAFDGSKLWQKASMFPSGTVRLVPALTYAQNWVNTYYHGSWPTAHTMWTTNGNF